MRQQIEESEAKQRATLHALRERNFQSEDLRKALSHATYVSFLILKGSVGSIILYSSLLCT